MAQAMMTSHSEFPKAYYKVATALGMETTLENMYKIEAFAKGYQKRTSREVEDFFESEAVMGFDDDE